MLNFKDFLEKVVKLTPEEKQKLLEVLSKGESVSTQSVDTGEKDEPGGKGDNEDKDKLPPIGGGFPGDPFPTPRKGEKVE